VAWFLLFAVGMVNPDPRRLLLLLALQPALVFTGCATDDDDLYEDIDGSGKGDTAISSDPDRLIDVPFYFSLPKTVVTTRLNRPAYPYPTLWNGSQQASDVGLRIIAVQQGSTLASKKQARREMAQKLAQAGVLQDGDLVLTFRPELAGTMAYPHIQMGTTHVGLVYTDGGSAFNIDSPLDSSYVGQFDASHYAGDGANDAGADALHIVRPRGMTDARRAQLREWVGTLKRNVSRINGSRQQIKFQSDYLVPAFVSAGKTTRQTVTTLGKIILEADTTTKQPMYCSEFAWHMLALSACSAEQIRNAGPEGASCVDDVFAPMPLVASSATEVGLADGPLMALMNLPEPIRLLNVPKIFETGDAARLSSGHRAVSEQVAPLMAPLQQFYTARASGAPVEATAEGAMQLSAQMPNNYSPTAFLVQAMADDQIRATDYVVTLAFVGSAGYEKARRLAQNPVP
jgi:hypothetical protein